MSLFVRGCAIGLLAAVLWQTLSQPALSQIHAMPPTVATSPDLTPSVLRDSGPLDPGCVVTPGTSVGDGLSTHCYGGDPRPVGLPNGGRTCWTWQLLPDGLLYKSYLAGQREPRLGSQWVQKRDYGWVWDSTLGGRVGVLRYGSTDDLYPEGWQIDIEGAAFPRLDAEHARDLIDADFRVGVPLTWRRGPWEAKLAYYHLSAHLGDEFMVTHPAVPRINYVRDCAVIGLGLHPHPDWRLYSEVGYGMYVDGGALPWEFQFGIEYSPLERSTIWGAPFAASNAHLRQENDFSGNFTVQLGWQWRGASGHLMRVGAHYFNGMSEQYQFYRDFEEQVGIGLWYDF